MLQTIRDKTAGTVVKVLFLLLVASFAVWGIGDYRFLQRSETPPVKIGGEALPLEVLRQEYQRDLDRLRRSVGEIDREVLRQLGIANQTIERVTNQTVLDRTVEKLGLVVSDDVVRQRIALDPNFRVSGVFDPNQFRRLLQDNNLTEGRYVQLVRGDTARSALADAVTVGAGTPPVLTDRIFRYREEKRRGEQLFIPTASMPEPPAPSDDDIKRTYEANLARFTEPELRAGILVRIGVEEILPTIRPDEAQLRAEFDARQREFSVPERRTLEIVRFADEAAAKAAKERLDAGADLLAIAQEAGQTPEQIRFGTLTQSELPSELAQVVFTLAANAISAPIVTPLGAFLARATEIQAGREAKLDDVRERLANELSRRIAGDTAYRVATRVEDALNGGQSLADAAKAAGIDAIAIEGVDSEGRDRSGKPLPAFADAPEAVRSFFDTPQGRETGLIETRAGIYLFGRVDSITPSQARALDSVKDQVAAAWAQQQRDAAARARAEEIVKAAQAGTDLAASAEKLGIKVDPIVPTRRDGRTDSDATRVAPAIAARLFQLKPDELGTAAGGDGYYVVKLIEVIAADPASDQAAVKRLSDALAQTIAGELAQQYLRALRQGLDVQVDPSAADRVGNLSN